MPPRTASPSTRSRRELLAALGAAGSAAVAGCSALLGDDERSLGRPAEVSDTATGHVWEFPRDEATPVVQVFLDQRHRVPRGADAARVRFRFGATVFGDSGYHHDGFEARFTAPATPDANQTPAPIFVEPPSGGWESFRVYRDRDATVVDLADLETEGTIHFDFLVDPVTAPTPETLGFAFTVTAAEGGGDNAVASHDGQVSIVRESA